MEDYKDKLQQIKRNFYSLRNGIVADSLKKIYEPDVMIFGLNLPQFTEISNIFDKDLALGLALWEDKKCRESRLLSLFIIPQEKLDLETAKKMVRDVRSIEEAELLPFKLLKRIPESKKLLEELKQEEPISQLQAYCTQMFEKNLTQ